MNHFGLAFGAIAATVVGGALYIDHHLKTTQTPHAPAPAKVAAAPAVEPSSEAPTPPAPSSVAGTIEPIDKAEPVEKPKAVEPATPRVAAAKPAIRSSSRVPGKAQPAVESGPSANATTPDLPTAVEPPPAQAPAPAEPAPAVPAETATSREQ